MYKSCKQFLDSLWPKTIFKKNTFLLKIISLCLHDYFLSQLCADFVNYFYLF